MITHAHNQSRSKNTEPARQVRQSRTVTTQYHGEGSGQFSPETTGGKKLLAHELTHVVQQKGGSTLFSEKGKGRLNRVPNTGRDVSEQDRVQRVTSFQREPVSLSILGLTAAKVSKDNKKVIRATVSSRGGRGVVRSPHCPGGFRSSDATSNRGIVTLQRSPAPPAGTRRPGRVPKLSTTARLVIKAPTKPAVREWLSGNGNDVLSVYVGGVLVLEARAPRGQLKYKLLRSWDSGTKTFHLSFTPGRGVRLTLGTDLEHRLRRALPGARIVEVPTSDTVALPLPPRPKPRPTLIGQVVPVLSLRARIISSRSFLGASVVTLRRGSRVTVLARKGSWYRVRYRNKEGWIHKSRIERRRRIIIRSGDTGSGTARGEAELSGRG